MKGIRRQHAAIMKKWEKRLKDAQGVVDGVEKFANGVTYVPRKIFEGIGKLGCTVIGWFQGGGGKDCNVDLSIKLIPDFEWKPDLNLEALKDMLSKYLPDVDPIDLDWDAVLVKLEANSIPRIREKLMGILKSFFNPIEKYSCLISRMLYLTIILTIWDATKYMRNYYVDDSFDNKFVNDNLRALWRRAGMEKLTPLRRWELRDKYQYTAAFKLSQTEIKDMLLQSIPCLLFGGIASCIVVADYALSSLLQVFRDNAQFGVSFPGCEQGISLGKFQNARLFPEH